jgi:hypothetical protein
MPGASKPPRFPKRLGGNTCVQDLSEASLGSLLFVIVSGLSLRASTRARSHGMISRPGYCSTRPLQIARATVRIVVTVANFLDAGPDLDEIAAKPRRPYRSGLLCNRNRSP